MGQLTNWFIGDYSMITHDKNIYYQPVFHEVG